MDPILSAIDDALKKKQLSPAAASKLAVGNYALIKNMKSSRSEEKRYNVGALEKLAEVLDLEFYFGPPREHIPFPTTEIDGKNFAAIPRYDAALAAGNGVLNSDTNPIEHLAFSRDWLSRMGVLPSESCLLAVKGNSMKPSLRDGDLVLIDRRKHAIRNGHIYAFNDLDGASRVKRLTVVAGKAIIIASDNDPMNPEERTGPEMNIISEGIIGEVVWSGHTWK